jgi:hypothetical protein
MPEGPGCQVDAGIIDEQCKLTPKAKKKFIQQVKDELLFGTDNLPVPPLFPCGDPVPPNPFADLLDLENEQKFPDFHKNILGSYQKIACALNLKSDFKLLPICCPISLAFKLGVNIKIDFPSGFIPFMIPNPPLLALKLKIMPPPKLIAKFPGLPAIPPPLPKFDIPPAIKIPDFKTLFDFSLAFALGIPKFLAELVLQIPKLALKLPNLPELFKLICDIAFKSNLFGSILPDSIVQIVTTKVLITKVVEMVFIAAIGTTLGSSPGGITGGVGKFLGYDPPPEEPEDPSPTIRDKIIEHADRLIDTGYGQGSSKQDTYAQNLLLVEYSEPQQPSPPGDKRALGKAKTLAILKETSSCGLVARACLANAGASYVYNNKVDTSKQDPSVNLYYDFFLDRYQTGTAIAGIYGAAKAKGALIPYTSGDLPALKKGDIIIVEARGNPGKEHVIVLYKDYNPGSLTMTTVEGGQPDSGNGGKPTMVRKKEYINSKTVTKGSDKYSMYIAANNQIYIAGRTVLALIDSEKLVTDQRGASMSKSNGGIPTSVASDGPGFGFQEEV